MQIADKRRAWLVGADGLAAQTPWVTATGVLFIALLTWICYRGIEISAPGCSGAAGDRIDRARDLLPIVAFVRVGSGHALPGAQTPALHWLNPWTGSFSTLSDSFLLAVFVYWGWDCALSVNEETKDSSRTPGKAGVMSTLILVAVFAVVSTAALAFAGPAFLSANSSDVLSAMANAVLGSTAGKLLILCVLTSTAASTQTTIMPTARAVLAMAAHGALPARLARISPRRLTPAVATIAMGAVSAIFYVLLTRVQERPGRLGRGHRAADRVLLRPDRIRLRLVLPA